MLKRRRIVTIHSMFVMTLTALMLVVGALAQGQQRPETQGQDELASSIREPEETNGTKTVQALPSYADLKGVWLGMTADEVREKLGNVKDKGKSQDFFVFSEARSAQVYYDNQGKVMAMSIDYFGADSKAPLPETVLGEDLQARPDGSMHKLKRYPEAGYWIAYNRTAGENPITTVTIQKM